MMEHTSYPELDEETRRCVAPVLGRIPQSLWVMTATWEDRRAAVLVSWVQQVAFNPPMVSVSLRKGRHIVPLLHDAHRFALSQIPADARLIIHKLTRSSLDEDPLEAVRTTRKVSGAPIISGALSYLDCELARHLDVEADHDLYIGAVLDGGILHREQPSIHLRSDGFDY